MSQIFFIENPLMDISKEFDDNSLINKYKLNAGQAQLATPEHVPLYDELFKMDKVDLIPGGSTLNSCRATDFILKQKGLCCYYGCIGKDKFGDALEKTLVDLGINVNFHKDEEAPTGTCACIIVKNERTLCANLAAALKYPTSHLDQNINNLNNAKLIYSSSFFITSNYEALLKVAKHASETNTPFAFNLSAVFLIQFNFDQVASILPYADYIFANEDEAAAFGATQSINDKDLSVVAKCLANWRKINEKRGRTVIITQGAEPVIEVTVQDGKETKNLYAVEPLEKSKVIDTNGAGDSFVGGFLSQIYQGKSIAEGINVAIKLSREVVQRSGCTFGDDFKI